MLNSDQSLDDHSSLAAYELPLPRGPLEGASRAPVAQAPLGGSSPSRECGKLWKTMANHHH